MTNPPQPQPNPNQHPQMQPFQGQPPYGQSGYPTLRPPKKNNNTTLIVLLIVFGGIFLLCGGCFVNVVSSIGDSSSKSDKTTTTKAPVVAAPAPTTAARATTTAGSDFTPGQPRSPRCKALPDQYLALINASFNTSTYSLGNPWAIQSGDRWWLGGNIMDGDHKVHSADVWVSEGPLVFSLSGGARNNSTLPDGRHLLNLSAGDADGIAVQNCVTAR